MLHKFHLGVEHQALPEDDGCMDVACFPSCSSIYCIFLNNDNTGSTLQQHLLPD